jgi:hypothetical protein
MHTDPNVLQLKAHLNDIERAFEASKTGDADLRGLAFRVRPVVVGIAFFAGAVVSLGGLI